MERKSVESRVSDVLSSIGVPTSLKGYKYLRAAIVMSMDSPNQVDLITKSLYPKVAAVFGTTPSRVERSIRHAIEVAFERGGLEVIHEYFGNTINPNKGKATNKEFISLIVDRLLLEESV